MTRIPECLIKPNVACALRALVRALHLHIPNGDLGFLCPGCRKRVHPVKDHFEHVKENLKCPLVLRYDQVWSPPAPKTRRAATARLHFASGTRN